VSPGRSTIQAAGIAAAAGTLLLFLTAKPWLSAVVADVDSCAAVARCVGVAIALAARANVRRALPPVQAMNRFFGAVAGLFAVAALSSAGPLVAGEIALDPPLTLNVAASSLAECIGSAVLGACLLEVTTSPRSLVASFLAVSWVWPTLVGANVPAHFTVGASAASHGVPDAPTHMWIWSLSVGAAALAVALLRPKIEAA